MSPPLEKVCTLVGLSGFPKNVATVLILFISSRMTSVELVCPFVKFHSQQGTEPESKHTDEYVHFDPLVFQWNSGLTAGGRCHFILSEPASTYRRCGMRLRFARRRDPPVSEQHALAQFLSMISFRTGVVPNSRRGKSFSLSFAVSSLRSPRTRTHGP